MLSASVSDGIEHQAQAKPEMIAGRYLRHCRIDRIIVI